MKSCPPPPSPKQDKQIRHCWLHSWWDIKPRLAIPAQEYFCYWLPVLSWCQFLDKEWFYWVDSSDSNIQFFLHLHFNFEGGLKSKANTIFCDKTFNFTSLCITQQWRHIVLLFFFLNTVTLYIMVFVPLCSEIIHTLSGESLGSIQQPVDSHPPSAFLCRKCFP